MVENGTEVGKTRRRSLAPTCILLVRVSKMSFSMRKMYSTWYVEYYIMRENANNKNNSSEIVSRDESLNFFSRRKTRVMAFDEFSTDSACFHFYRYYNIIPIRLRRHAIRMHYIDRPYVR